MPVRRDPNGPGRGLIGTRVARLLSLSVERNLTIEHAVALNGIGVIVAMAEAALKLYRLTGVSPRNAG